MSDKQSKLHHAVLPLHSLIAPEDANYDPQANTEATIRRLREGVARIESKVIELARNV